MNRVSIYLLLMACLFLPKATWALELYVSPAGNDSWSGRMEQPLSDRSDGPFATVAGARDAVRKLKAEGLNEPVTVLVREGEYALSAPLVFNPEDSGTALAPITYAAYPGERPVLSGGRKLGGWRVEEGRWVLDLPADVRSSLPVHALWVNGERRTPARTPNTGHFFSDGLVENPEKPGEFSKDILRYQEQNAAAWQDAENAIAVVTHAWDISILPVKSIDRATRQVTFAFSSPWPFGQWTTPVVYYLTNTLTALDAPGEWYLNAAEGRLYYLPLPGERPDEVEVTVPVTSELLLLKGEGPDRTVSHLRFEGLTFAYADVELPQGGYRGRQAAVGVDSALSGDWVQYCAWIDCEIAHTANHALSLNQGARYNRITRNHIHDFGAGGVMIGSYRGQSSDPELTAGWNEVDNNWVHAGSRTIPSGCGIWIGDSHYNTVSHNEIADLYYTGISVGWAWGYGPSNAHHNIIEYNHIHKIGQGVLSDMGGIYTLGVSPGTVLRNNWIHDVWSMTYGGWGIYLDEGSTQMLVENNLVYSTKTGGFHQHYGKESRIRNNIFAYAAEAQIVRSREEEHISFYFERNIVLCGNRRLLGGRYGNGKFEFRRNCYWDISGEVSLVGSTFEERVASGVDIGSIVADPQFVDPLHGDFRLKPSSPALAMGFQPFDYTRAGLYAPNKWIKAAKKTNRHADRPLWPPRQDPDEMAFAPLWTDYQLVCDVPDEWRFCTDPESRGETEQWFAPTFDTASWRPLSARIPWEEQIGKNFDGFAWYRTSFDVPQEAMGKKLILSFGAVDEAAVVYVNGQRVGEFGVPGVTWNTRFEIDITAFVKQADKNLIAVRVQDTNGVGGIWRGVKVITPKQ